MVRTASTYLKSPVAALAVMSALTGCGARSALEVGELELVRGCPDGWDDCDGDGTCDTEIAVSSTDCALCGRACSGGLYCGRGECVPGETVVQLSAGGHHTCALRARGDVWCWGWNEDGQLGAGLDERFMPVAVLAVGLDDGVQLSLGARTTCARRRTGGIDCWGKMPTAESFPNTPSYRTPAAAPSVDHAAWVAAASSSACVLQAGGTVLCWGHNQHGNLGNGTFEASDIPLPVPGLVNAVSLSNHGATCARRADQTVVCWGYNEQAQVGDGVGHYVDGFPPADHTVPFVAPGLDRAVQIDTAPAYSCARREPGDLWCWGTWPTGSLQPPRLDETLSGPVAALATGASQLCILRPDGTAGCISHDHATKGEYPPYKGVVEGVVDAVAITSGGSHSCALLAGGSVVCWGKNDLGQLGNGVTEYASVTPVAVLGL